MKIMHVTNYLPGHHQICGGAEQAAYRQITALQKQDIENVVVTLKEDFQREEDFKYYQLATCETLLGNCAGNLRGLKKSITMLNRSLLYYDPIAQGSFRAIIEQEKPDLINYYNFSRLSFSLLEAAKSLFLPCVLSIYDYWCFCPNETLVKADTRLCAQFHGRQCLNCYSYGRFNFILRWLLFLRKPIFDKFLKKFDVFLVLSRASQQLLEKYGIPREKIEIIPQFYHPGEFKSSPPSESYGSYILFAGWLNHKKGLHVLVKAMKEVSARVKDVRLLVLGMEADRTYLKRIKDFVAQNSLQQKITFLDKVSPEQFKQYLDNAKLLVVPEQWENMSPVIIIEAMFAGVPIIASRIGGIPEFVIDGENGFLAEYNNPQDFAQKITLLLSDTNLQAKFSRRSQELAEKIFDRNTLIQRLLGIYEKTISNEPAK